MTKPPWHKGGTTRHEQGYGTAWNKLRLVILKRDCYLCQCPRCLGGKLRVTPANVVDHIKPKAQGGTDDPANLRAINKACHLRVTLEQQGKVFVERTGSDVHGNPTNPNHPWNKRGR
jgi:5-methylcytosine-specific restriction protein A